MQIFQPMKNLSISEFTYHLPEDKIANYPLPQRDLSKLLIYKDHRISASIFSDLPTHLPSGSLIIFNNSKVVEARLNFYKASGSLIEIFCLEPPPEYKDITTAFSSRGSVKWVCLIGGASKWKPGQVLSKKLAYQGNTIELTATFIEKTGGAFVVSLAWSESSLSFAEILHLAGTMPLPPYIKRAAEAEDADRYQTVYARYEGSVAAPTAGLHFTPRVLESLKEKNIQDCYITLHVGAGTFKPVKTETMETHEMHSEFIDVSRETVETILAFSGKQITAVGTTSMRTIESLYWLGVKTLLEPSITIDALTIGQWDPYEISALNISSVVALESLLKWMNKNQYDRIVSKTQLLIGPGYSVRIVDALVTNFHQPASTLLLLVAAMTGERWKDIYEYALQHQFRFLSYGDSCLLFRHGPLPSTVEFRE
jgi:S-adenosylmethionine:tRNA ribosyltransferase-isomerase